MSTIRQTECLIRDVAYLLPSIPCDRCHDPAERFSTATRTVIDIDLDQPVLLSVTVGVHHCVTCKHYFRAQPPFLQMSATYCRRVVQKAVDAVHQDGLAFRSVPGRLARDFWVRPSEGMIRRWCGSHQASLDFDADYQQWVITQFSGILCVDEVYQDQMALLLAVDPAAPDGDRLLGYQLVHGRVDGTIIDTFLMHLKEVGLEPEQVISDGSTLYPPVLAKVWPTAAHQLCLFHETRRLTKAAMEVIQAVRSALPTPPPQPGRGWRGPLRDQPPSTNPDDPASKRWQVRRAVRAAGIAQVHTLTHQGWSQRAIVRHLGIARQTVRKWQRLPLPVDVPVDVTSAWHSPKPPSHDAEHHAREQAQRAQIKKLAGQGLSSSAIARQVGLHRVTVKKWLGQVLPEEQGVQPESEQPVSDASAPLPGRSGERADVVLSPQPDSSADKPAGTNSWAVPPPPAAWASWDQVNQAREMLHDHRFLLLRHPKNLSTEDQAQLATVLSYPVPQLSLARSFLLDWYALWKDDQGCRRTVEEAKTRYDVWRSQAAYLSDPRFRRVLSEMTDEKFDKLSSFLRHPHWEATNNGAERFGRAFRHEQAPHFNLRSDDSIKAALAARACRQKASALGSAQREASRATRGRKRRIATPSQRA